MLLLVLGIAAAVVFSGHLERPNGMGTTMLMVIFQRNQGVLWFFGVSEWEVRRTADQRI